MSVEVADGAQLVDRLFAQHFRLPPLLSVHEWADRHRRLPKETSSEPGPWRTDRTPYLRQILQDLSDDVDCEVVAMQFGTQLGKSEAGLCWTGYIIDHCPGPMLVVQPTVDLVKRYSKQRVANLVRFTPALAGKVKESRSRDSGNTTLSKEFPGGILILTGANSAAGLASMPARYIHFDEVDDYPLDVDGQGEPTKIAVARQDTFARRKRLLTSSPKRPPGLSLIESVREQGTDCEYRVPCPHCGHYQPLIWAGEEDGPGLRFWNDDPSTAAYVCAGCGSLIQEHAKATMLPAGVWVPRNADPEPGIRSYHLSSLYSPLGWLSWSKICAEYRDAVAAKDRGDQSLIKTWTNTRLALPYEEVGERLDGEKLRARAVERPARLVPMACLVLTCGVDVQDNRLEVTTWAWGPGEECAPIEHVQIWGDPLRTERLPDGELTVWERLDAFVEERYPHEGGQTLGIEAMAIDTGGHCTHAVYNYCRARAARRVRAGGAEWIVRTYAIKGMDRPGMPVKGKASPVDVNWAGQTIKHGVKLWMVGTGTAKDWLHGHLKNVREPGPGYVHLSTELPPEWFEQMTAEKRIQARTARGYRYVWALEAGKRNEALDCAVYALFAAHAMDLPRYTERAWARLRERVVTTQGDLLSSVPAAPAPSAPSQAPSAERAEEIRPVAPAPPASDFGSSRWADRW